MTQNPTASSHPSPNQPSGSGGTSEASKTEASKQAGELKNVAGDAAHGAAEKGKDLQAKAAEQGEKLKRKASEIQDEASRRTREARDYVSDKVRTEANKRQSVLAAGLKDAAEAVRSASSTLKEKDAGGVATYIDSAAKKFEGVASYLDRADPGEVLDDGRELARRYPEFFFGGMFLAGLAAARFLKASESRRDTRSGRPHESNVNIRQRPRGATSGTRQLSQPSTAGYTTQPAGGVRNTGSSVGTMPAASGSPAFGTTANAGPGTSRSSSSL